MFAINETRDLIKSGGNFLFPPETALDTKLFNVVPHQMLNGEEFATKVHF